MAVSGSLSCEMRVGDTRNIGLATGRDIGWQKSTAFPITDGSGAGAGNKVYHATRTLGAASEDVDLQNLTDAIGAALSFSRVIALRVANESTTASLTLGAASANAWTNAITGAVLPPKTATNPSFIAICAANSAAFVVASNNKVLKVAGTSGQSYTLEIVGS